MENIADNGYFIGSSSLPKDFVVPKKSNSEKNISKTMEAKNVLENQENHNQTPKYDNDNTIFEKVEDCEKKNNVTLKRQNSDNSALTYKDTYPQIKTINYPKELTSQFEALDCKLCAMKLTSTALAKIHYVSRNHEKKVRAWLEKWSKETGQPLPKKQNLTESSDNDNDPKYKHCDLCDISFTSRIHAESHYMGKSHQKVVMNKKGPSGTGYYDEEGIYHRTKTANADPTGRFGIGTSFVSNNTSQPPVPGMETINSEEVVDTNQPNQHLYCEHCNVSVTRFDQMTAHLIGQKHIKTLRRLGIESNEKNLDQQEPSLLSTVTDPKNGTCQDLSVYRTPSGNYYCGTCNVSVNSEISFTQHIQSKKHANKVKVSKQN